MDPDAQAAGGDFEGARGWPVTEKRRLLRVLRLFLQGFRLITGGLTKEIAELEQEMKDEPTHTAETVSDKA